jgi:hypothetical protein
MAERVIPFKKRRAALQQSAWLTSIAGESRRQPETNKVLPGGAGVVVVKWGYRKMREPTSASVYVLA